MLFRKNRAKPPREPVPDPGFVLAGGPHYIDVLGELHAALDPGWYLEIGTQKGRSLAKSRSRSIAIDPHFQLAGYEVGEVPEVHLFQTSSDAFFAGSFLKASDIRLDLAFLDGMHLFEYLLRDFMNCERAASSDAIFAVHDCMPVNLIMSDRTWDHAATRQWTGDVWKLLPILREHRPALNVRVLDCAPTGLVLVSGLDPSDDVLPRAYEAIVEEWAEVTLDGYGVERFFSDFPFTESAAEVARLTAGRQSAGSGS